MLSSSGFMGRVVRYFRRTLRRSPQPSWRTIEPMEPRTLLSAAVEPYLLAEAQASSDSAAVSFSSLASRAAPAPKAQVAASMLASPIIIDHRWVTSAARLPQSTMDLLAARDSFFFAHASVGGDIVSGLYALHQSAPRRYKLIIASDDATPPPAVRKGRVYEFDRGNPSWQRKVDDFKTYLAKGWGTRAGVLINKFCYIDPGVTLQYYAVSNRKRSAMSQLEQKYPAAKFVYTTIPLTTENGGDNIARNQFNSALRAFAAANNKILWDIADIEAWSPKGVQSTFRSGGKTCQKMYAGYTTDGGHPNAAGARRLALAFYNLAAAVVSSGLA